MHIFQHLEIYPMYGGFVQGNLLDDTELIDVLAITKQTAGEVNERLIGASETNKKINEACEEYRPVAHRATLLYFLIAEYTVVNCMYQTSLNQVRAASHVYSPFVINISWLCRLGI